MVHTTVIACATLLHLSITTQLEMGRILPSVQTYFLANPNGVVTATYKMK